jgi:hypothetical protein
VQFIGKLGHQLSAIYWEMRTSAECNLLGNGDLKECNFVPSEDLTVLRMLKIALIKSLSMTMSRLSRRKSLLQLCFTLVIPAVKSSQENFTSNISFAPRYVLEAAGGLG